jgi:5-methylcytosine-specific restriction endonuclease McrA
MTDPFYLSPTWKRLREAALRRDGFVCIVPGCGARATHVDHIKRRRDGGADSLPNLRSLCQLHDSQVKERSDGTRANGGKFRLVGCDVDGWPYERG